MILSKTIARLRINSFLLFLVPSIAIIGSLLIHNLLTDPNSPAIGIKYGYLTDEPGKKYNTKCIKDNGFCYGEGTEYLTKKSAKIDGCFVHSVKTLFTIDGIANYKKDDVFNFIKNEDGISGWYLKKEYNNSKILLTKIVSNEKNKSCIKNYKTFYFLYKYFPPFSYIIDEKTKGLSLGTHSPVNPFLYGEVSISNLVKRHPIKIFFKFFLYMSVILMITYWYNYNKIFKKILNQDTNIFYFFGLSSAVFLFFHVYYLGTTSNNEILNDFRRIIVVLFILFEVFAQTLLAHKLYINKNIFLKHCFNLFVLSKVIFVSLVLIFTITVMIMLSIFNFPSNIDYILEWNYFIILLVFYLLSALMWKKIN